LTDEKYGHWLTDERYTWRKELELGIWYEPDILTQYRLFRDSDLWRATRQVEKLCEYILHLEGAKTMSETITVLCDACQSDISKSEYYPHYRLRLTQELRQILPGAEQKDIQPELEDNKNFCNLACLKNWSNKE